MSSPKRPASDDLPGTTQVVRVDREEAGPAPPVPRRTDAMPSAPKKGLQVQLPDDEPAPKPPPPKVVAPPPAKSGRRGAWWDEKHDKPPDDPDDVAGGTAIVSAPEPEPEPEPEPVAAAPEPEQPAAETPETGQGGQPVIDV